MQGFNMGRYVPPDQEGLTTGNKLAGKHPLGARARHLQTKGALIVRFEMPFAVWCDNCKPKEVLIGQGVRFNAEKKRVGNYYSTPIYSFRMKHTSCGGWIEIRTDPQNTAYVVTEGGRKRDTGEDDETGENRIRLGHEGDRDAFAKLEGKVQDKKQFDAARSRVLELQKRQDRDWDDPYEKSKRLRRTFREERKALEKTTQIAEALKDKMSLGIDLLEETEDDRARASRVEFGDSAGDLSRVSRTKPMFEKLSPPLPSQHPPSATAQTLASHKDGGKRGRKLHPSDSSSFVAERKAVLGSELRGSIRAALDPFLNGEKTWQPEIIRRRKAQEPILADEKDCSSKDANRAGKPTSASAAATSTSTATTTTIPVLDLDEELVAGEYVQGPAGPASTMALVDYLSDSDR
ncbi:Family of unknown function (DUF572) domain containing protein [Elaphomyces granulatus]